MGQTTLVWAGFACGPPVGALIEASEEGRSGRRCPLEPAVLRARCCPAQLTEPFGKFREGSRVERARLQEFRNAITKSSLSQR